MSFIKKANQTLCILLIVIIMLFSTPITVFAVITDTNGPLITVVSCDRKNETLYEGDSIKLIFSIEDPSGIGSNVGMLMTYVDPNGENYREFIGPPCKPNATTGLYECTFTVSATHKIGTYKFAKLHAYDAVDNYSYINTTYSFVVAGTETDTVGPTITEIFCDKVNQALCEGDSIKYIFKLEDPSGIGSIVNMLMTYRNPDGENYREFLGPPCKLNETTGWYECVFTVNSTHKVGTYSFAKLSAYDQKSNSSYIRPDKKFYVKSLLLIENCNHQLILSEASKDASCTEPGKKLYECKFCDYQEEVTIESKGHKYDNDCDADCNICQETRKVEPHKYDNACDSNCNICGESREISHNYNAATCTLPKTCKVCNLTEGLNLGHSYTNACDSSCNRCGSTRTITHSYSNSCDTDCNICNAIRTISHKYLPATCTKPETCTVCGVTSGKKLGHDIVNVVSKKATCEDCGTITKSCKNCDYMIFDIIEPLGHKEKKEPKVVSKATFDDYASLMYVCERCGGSLRSDALPYISSVKLSTTKYTYNGKVKTPSVTVKDSAGKTLKKNTDYTVTYASGRKNVGTYKVSIKMIGKYSGTKTLTFKINPAKLSSYKLSTTAYTYDGKTKTPSVTVKNASGTKLTKNTHYIVTYASGRKNVGTYKVTIKGKGNYTGTKTLTFKINPAKTTVSKLTAGKKSFTVAITKKSAQVTGYQIQYSTSKKFTNAKTKTISSYKTTKYTLKSSSVKKTYYVRVRTYKTVGKTKYYSGWSTYKYVKTK